MNSTAKTVLFWVLVLASAGVLWTVVQNGKSAQREKEVSFSGLSQLLLPLTEEIGRLEAPHQNALRTALGFSSVASVGVAW